jgi:FtsP/CotA-like multicopper oxidase with cupredoxin domain
VHLIQFQVLNREQVQWAIDPATGQPTWDSGFNPYRNGANRILAAPAAAKPGSWDYLFPGGTFAGMQADGTWGSITYPPHTFIPGYGPPTDYTAANADGALGGNLAFGKFLVGTPVPPDPNEAGWKDTFKVLPGMVNRVVLRWAPQAVTVGGAKPGQNLFSFDPTRGPGYVWHCHILDHEDNEMMRPYLPTL